MGSRPIRVPAKTKRSIRDIPVMMSGFMSGIFVAFITSDFIYLFFIRLMPYAAAVPSIVEMTVEVIARTTVFLSAPSVISSRKSSLYHLREKPSMTAVLLPELKLKYISTAIGAKRNTKISTR